jgi:4-amino-4-deoxy-L-arabinose transferase-like glycosyltransferase
MNAATKLDGERIAKDVLAQAATLAVLAKRRRLLSNWNCWIPVTIGIAWGDFIATYSGPYTQWILGAASGIAVSLAVTAFDECISLRRRLDAVIVLLRIDKDSPAPVAAARSGE